MTDLVADAVIVCRGSSVLLERAVEALLRDPSVGRVVLVDNGQTDGQLRAIRDRIGDRVLVVGDGRNLGFGAGVNLGARQVRNAGLAIVNPDCIVGPGAVGRLLQTLHGDTAAAAAGGLLVNEDGSEQDGARRDVPSLTHAIARRLRLQRVPGIGSLLDFNQAGRDLPSAATPVHALSGAFMVVRTRCFEDVGGFDERYFLHFEDLDLCIRLRAAGGVLFFDPGARAEHRKGESSSKAPLFVTWHKHRSYVLFRWMHAGWLTRACVFPFDLAGACLSLGASAVRAAMTRRG